ncbi:MAG: hypothetical protein WDZ51_07795 [Pirellulaceae bacterium]
MPRRIFRTLLLGVLLLAWGCRPAAPVPSTANSSASQTPKSDALPPAETPSANVTVDPGTPELELVGESPEFAPIVEEQDPLGPGAVQADEVPDPNPPEKLLLMTTAGPLRVDIRVWIEGKPHPLAMESLVDRFLGRPQPEGEAAPPDEQADPAPDFVTWDQLLDQPAVKSGLYGNLGHETDSDRKQLLDRYDANRNGKVEPPELVRFLTRNRAVGRTFSIRPTAYAGDRQRENSPLWQWLDRDGDGRLVPSELAGVADRLRVADLNDDQLVTAEELQQARASTPVMPGMEEPDPRRFQGPRSAYLLEERTDWFSLLDGIERIYQFGAPVSWSLLGSPEQLAVLDPPVMPELRLDGNDLPRLRDLPAEVMLETWLGAGNPRLEVVLAENATSGWELETKPSASILTGPGKILVFRLRDLPGSELSEAEVEQFMARADRNGDGYLTELEFMIFPGLLGAVEFAAADHDGDGQLYPDEIREAMMAQRLVERAQVRIQSLDGVDPLFWQLDENRDGRLSPRELAGVGKRLADWVTRADQLLQAEQIPGVMVFEIYRGEDDPAPQPLRIAEPFELDSDEQEDRPAWHQAMDSNGDGDISRREFLGTDAQFQMLDRDSDGLISAEETAGR